VFHGDAILPWRFRPEDIPSIHAEFREYIEDLARQFLAIPGVL
jgi:hypothetical protein